MEIFAFTRLVLQRDKEAALCANKKQITADCIDVTVRIVFILL